MDHFWSHEERLGRDGMSFHSLKTRLFSKVTSPYPSNTPPKKKIKMYFMKLLYMKHLLAVIKWTI